MNNGELFTDDLPAREEMNITDNGARSLLRYGSMQSDLDANFFRILNLDISNIPFPPTGQPPSVMAPPPNWLTGWSRETQQWFWSQPGFSDLLPATGDVVFSPSGQYQLKNIGYPHDPMDAVNFEALQELVTAIPGINPLEQVKVATTGAITLTGLQTIDDYVVQQYDRVLVKDQANPAQNGIYIAGTSNWQRSPDADTGPKLVSASTVVTLGTFNAHITWIQVTPAPITLGVSPIVWVMLFNGNVVVQAGFGLVRTGTVFSIDPAYPGQTSINTLGTITTGTWQGSPIDPVYVFPDQTDKAGWLLGTDGTTPLWQKLADPLSAGGLSPLFDAQVLNPDTTPQLTFTQQNAPAGTVFANPGAADAPPVFTKTPLITALPNLTTPGMVVVGPGGQLFSGPNIQQADFIGQFIKTASPTGVMSGLGLLFTSRYSQWVFIHMHCQVENSLPFDTTWVQIWMWYGNSIPAAGSSPFGIGVGVSTAGTSPCADGFCSLNCGTRVGPLNPGQQFFVSNVIGISGGGISTQWHTTFVVMEL